MSDAGIYAALEADIVTKLTGVGGLVTVVRSMSATELVYYDGIQKPAAGLIHTGTDYIKPARGVNAPHYYGRVKYQIAICVQNLRGRIAARPTLLTAIEAIRGALHFKQPSGLPVSNTGLYMAGSEVYADQHIESLAVAAVNYNIELMLGN